MPSLHRPEWVPFLVPNLQTRLKVSGDHRFTPPTKSTCGIWAEAASTHFINKMEFLLLVAGFVGGGGGEEINVPFFHEVRWAPCPQPAIQSGLKVSQ